MVEDLFSLGKGILKNTLLYEVNDARWQRQENLH